MEDEDATAADGGTYIALERRQLRGLTSLEQWYRLGHLLLLLVPPFCTIHQRRDDF